MASDFPASNDEFHKTQKLEQSSKTPWRHLVSAARRVPWPEEAFFHVKSRWWSLPLPLGGRRAVLCFSVHRRNQTRSDPAGECPAVLMSEDISLTIFSSHIVHTVQVPFISDCFVCMTFALNIAVFKNEYSVSTRIYMFLYSFLVF